MKTDLYGSVLDNKGNIFEKLGLKLDGLCYLGVQEVIVVSLAQLSTDTSDYLIKGEALFAIGHLDRKTNNKVSYRLAGESLSQVDGNLYADIFFALALAELFFIVYFKKNSCQKFCHRNAVGFAQGWSCVKDSVADV